MMPRSVTVPFSIPDLYGGFGEADGMAEVGEDALVLRFQVKDSWVRLLKSGVKEVRVPLEEIASADLKSGPFRTILTVVTNDFAAASSVPGSKHGRIKLRIAREGREAAKEAESLLKLRLAQKELEGFRKELGRGGQEGSSEETV
jgi:hypothetical protein